MSTPLHATEAEKSPAMISLDRQIKSRVLQGIEFLKKEYGEDWVEHIDMKKLSLSDGDCCILGQVHPAYHSVTVDDDGYTWEEEGYEAAVEHFNWHHSDYNTPRKLGFLDGEVDGVNASFTALQKAWEEEIERVKCESSASTTSKAAS